MFAKKTPLTPELVVSGGYCDYSFVPLFPEKDGIEYFSDSVKCELDSISIIKNIYSFAGIHKYQIISEKTIALLFP